MAGPARARLRLLLACPYLVFFAHPPLAVACAVCVVASVGYSATLMLQQRLIALTPDDLQGHALGVTRPACSRCREWARRWRAASRS